MIKNQNNRLIIIVVFLALALWIDLSDNIFISNPLNGSIAYKRNVTPQLGLDLRGGLPPPRPMFLPNQWKLLAASSKTALTLSA